MSLNVLRKAVAEANALEADRLAIVGKYEAAVLEIAQLKASLTEANIKFAQTEAVKDAAVNAVKKTLAEVGEKLLYVTNERDQLVADVAAVNKLRAKAVDDLAAARV